MDKSDIPDVHENAAFLSVISWYNLFVYSIPLTIPVSPRSASGQIIVTPLSASLKVFSLNVTEIDVASVITKSIVSLESGYSVHPWNSQSSAGLAVSLTIVPGK